MANILHLNFLKYFAIFGIMPYIEETTLQEYQQKQQMQQGKRQRIHFYHHPNLNPNHKIKQYQQHTLHSRHQRRQHSHIVCHKHFLLWQQIYTVLIIVGIVLTTLYGLIKIPFDDTSIIPDLVSIIVFVIHFIAIIVILLETMFSYEKYFELLINHMAIQQLFKQLLQTQLCVQTIRQRHKRKLFFYILTVYGCILVSITVITLKPYYGYFWHALVMILILRSRCLQMLILLDFMFYYLDLLKTKLKALVSCRMSKNYYYLDVNYRYVESYVYMENVKFIYMQIFVLHKQFNDIFGMSLLMLLIGIALDIIIHVYWSFLTVMGLYEMYFLYITVATLIPLFTMIFMLCFAAEDCEKECNHILISLKHLIKPTITCQQTADYNALLRDFIMQIIHNPIRITANEYFTINLKFLMGISANIVTYLVILLQFRKTSDAKAMTSSDITISYDLNMTTADMMRSNN